MFSNTICTSQSIWPGMCNVEMYGSCATQLDLPSSDLDVVVRGLDRPSEKFATSSSNVGKSNESSGDTKERNPEASPIGRVVNPVVVQHSPQMVYGHLSLNAERIVRLAMELERQPWAVHVKAIPTATVPVIKILADPTRTSGNGEWLMQPPIAAEASPANGQSMAEQAESNGATQNSMAHFQGQQTPPWRGADVMNGLLKVDITFEGPEHGGIGSTKFSSRVVKEFCDETGLPPDGTPAVQVLMVVKELLAQRRLNEPFSGGLSSYALLLFVISVLRERAIIREELEKVERQRRMVAAGNVDPGLRVFPSESVTSSGEKRDAASTSKTKATKAESLVQEKRSAKVRSGKITNDQVESGISSAANKNGKKEPELGKAKPPAAAAPAGTEKAGSSNALRPAASSWASIAKKSSSSAPPRKPIHERAQSNPSEKKAPQQQTKTLRKASSFADAVANGSQGGSKQPSNAAPPASKSKKGEVRNNSGNKAPPKKAPSNTKEKSSAQPSSASSGRDTNSQLDVQAPIAGSGSMFPQGFHDVTEVLCSGETTAGKLLMHFLLFYGQHFDSQSTAIDYSWTHQRDANGNNGYSQMSPYMLRRTAGSYDPMTGMLSVDPIVVYDPLEGAETNNVARSCFAWSSIRWVFAQSYLTLLSTVEINQNHTSGQGARGASVRSDGKKGTANENKSELSHPWNGPYGHDKSGNMMIDPSSPLLELLLSF
jgi:DNA polymerase sigma